ncbi:hypothetical protein MCOR25_008499 [Pyricularia grisea]|uniref:Uncharacterized protein n=1 Tax=Pyricularia grisea TaxID=148305 RepID=A0A6P8BAK4_PYRGI|nr:uncharacterized protein PgNI_02845 [Pyricularia grisea]KAI6354676.1 hypothetical protein MCOR25_008499 [Pyricularia grisea]TLD12855.1 hypothetical protein PgNI_02845 [Pyricularia grisea]
MGLAAVSRIVLLLFATVLCGVLAQDAPLWVQGDFEDATVTDDTFNSGGTVTVNGWEMKVPKNLLVQFPAAWVPWREFVAIKNDLVGFETLVMGNTVNGEQLVGQIVIYQFFENLASGYIESVNMTDGSLQLRNGPKVRINDPNGVFSVGYSGFPQFTADDVNPSITSFSGFPMCIPRNTTDPLCPMSQRQFTGAGIFTAPDPLVMAPLQAGDFITYAGVRKNGEILAFNIVVNNVQIQTTGNLAYVRVELALLGIDNPSPNAEITPTRFVGFTSNKAATVSIYAMDVDPCTGETKDRIIASTGLRGGGNEQNKFEYRNDVLARYTREYRVTVEINGIQQTRITKNGLTAGTYVAPVNVWVQGEQVVPGTAPVPHDFSEMGWLTQGVGADADGNIWGPIEPFPQSGVLIDVPVCATTSSARVASSNTTVSARDMTTRRSAKFKRESYAQARSEAIADAQNVGTVDPGFTVDPAEQALIDAKKAKKAAAAAAAGVTLA